MTWFTYDFFDPLLPSEKWRSNDASSVPQYIQDLAVDLPERISVIRCNDWNTDDYVGGIKTFESRVCVFRVCNGGRDNRGRPHRWVLIAAENDLSQWRSLDVLNALESAVFKQYAAAPVPSPAPFPSSAPECRPSSRINSGPPPDKQSIDGDDAERQIRDVSVWMSSSKTQGALLIVEKQKSQFRAWFRKAVSSSPIARPKITDAQQPPPLQVPQKNATTTTSATSNRKKHMFMKVSFVLAVVVGGVLGWIARGWWEKPRGSEGGLQVTKVELTKLDENGSYRLRLPFNVHKVEVFWLDDHQGWETRTIDRPSPSPKTQDKEGKQVHGGNYGPATGDPAVSK